MWENVQEFICLLFETFSVKEVVFLFLKKKVKQHIFFFLKTEKYAD